MFSMSPFGFRNRWFLLLLWMRRASLGSFPVARPLPRGGRWLWSGPSAAAPSSSRWACPTPGHLDAPEFRGRLGPRVLLRGGWLWICTHLAFVGACLGGFQVFSDSAKEIFFPLLASYFFKSLNSSIFLPPQGCETTKNRWLCVDASLLCSPSSSSCKWTSGL